MKPEPATAERMAKRDFDLQVRSSRPLIYIVSHEESRVLDGIRFVANTTNRQWTIITWDVHKGLEVISADKEDFNLNNTDLSNIKDQVSVLKWFEELKISKGNKYTILVLKDFHAFMGYNGQIGQIEEEVIRSLYNIAEDNISKHKVITFVSPVLHLPTRLERICAVIDWPLPERYYIEKHLNNVLDLIKDNHDLDKFQKEYSYNEQDAIISACQGLTMKEIELLMSYNINVSTDGGFDPVFLSNKKRDIIRKAGLIDWIDANDGLETVGGLKELKKWLAKRKRAFTEEARAYGLPENPKGLLLVGVQGCGKSLSARAIAKYWDLPLLRLDMGKVFAGIVGSSEANIRHVINIAESVSPCILWIDELEKGLSGVASSNTTDGGTAARVFGSILTWMQEKTMPVYVVATANDISQLPPELLRKGRFDEIFFIDLPQDIDREEIIKIHFDKRRRETSNFNMEQLIKKSESFTGAEIEAGIIAAMYESFNRGEEVTTRDIEESFTEMIPLSVTMKEEINDLRKWADSRARNASYIKRLGKERIKNINSEKEKLMKSIQINDVDQLGDDEL